MHVKVFQIFGYQNEENNYWGSAINRGVWDESNAIWEHGFGCTANFIIEKTGKYAALFVPLLS